MASSSSTPVNVDISPEEKTTPLWLLANTGIKMLINNDAKGAEELFARYPDQLIMFAGHSFVVFMDALMSLDQDKLDVAVSTLKEVERRCNQDTGWTKSFQKMFSSSGNSDEPSLADQLETQIILADSQVCIATLTFLQQDISGYLKGGWVLRKAWKVYQKVYRDISELYKQRVGELHLPDPLESPLPLSDSEWTISEKNKTNGKQDVDKKTIIRLMGAVSFGYGLFQLGVSLLPPSLTRVVSLLGFGANRDNGIDCLMYARLGVDMRAPLATLALLWYHTIVRPFYAVDGTNVKAGLDSAKLLLNESEKEFSESALFLFFKGRASRLNSDIPTAIKSYQMSVENATQREIKLLALHEVGWCHLIELDFPNAESIFSYMKTSSRWSNIFYGYLAAICTGSYRPRSEWNHLEDVRLSLEKSNIKVGQLDDFLTRRVKLFPKDPDGFEKMENIYWRLLIYEMVYLWNSLTSCNHGNVKIIIKDCQGVKDTSEEPMPGLSQLLLGACYCILKKHEDGIESFRKCLKIRNGIPHNSTDAHVSAFAQFELGHLLIKKSETRAEGKTLLQDISKYSKYDFESKLTVRVHYVLKNM